MSKTGTRVQGRTRWRRFAAASIPALAAAAGLVVAQGTGALAASFYISGMQATISADQMVGSGFGQYGWADAGVDGNPLGKYFPMALTGIKSATLTNLCQSVTVPLPIGNYTMVIKAGTNPNNPVTATDLTIDMTKMSGDASFKNIDIGIAASKITRVNDTFAAGVPDVMYGQQAETITVNKLVQTAYATSAGTFNLHDMTLELKAGTFTCPNA
jgi:hypothetical protein